MTCRHCQSLNAESDHRCGRCGRRLQQGAAWPASTPPGADTYPIMTATAPAFAMEAESSVAVAPEEDLKTSPNRRVSYQKALFPEMQRVMAMPVSTPNPAPAAPRRPRSRPANPNQQTLFASSTPSQATPVIYCDAPVAAPHHRLAAAAADASLVFAAFGTFMVTFRLAAGELMPATRPDMVVLFYVGILAVLWIFYHAFFCAFGSDTPGMNWFRLRLLNFEGHEPSREQRWQRLGGSCLGLAAAGLGLVWALVDEESLGWQDHISKTFPTPRDFRE